MQDAYIMEKDRASLLNDSFIQMEKRLEKIISEQMEKMEEKYFRMFSQQMDRSMEETQKQILLLNDRGRTLSN